MSDDEMDNNLDKQVYGKFNRNIGCHAESSTAPRYKRKHKWCSKESGDEQGSESPMEDTPGNSDSDSEDQEQDNGSTSSAFEDDPNDPPAQHNSGQFDSQNLMREGPPSPVFQGTDEYDDSIWLWLLTTLDFNVHDAAIRRQEMITNATTRFGRGNMARSEHLFQLRRLLSNKYQIVSYFKCPVTGHNDELETEAASCGECDRSDMCLLELRPVRYERVATPRLPYKKSRQDPPDQDSTALMRSDIGNLLCEADANPVRYMKYCQKSDANLCDAFLQLSLRDISNNRVLTVCVTRLAFAVENNAREISALRNLYKELTPRTTTHVEKYCLDKGQAALTFGHQWLTIDKDCVAAGLRPLHVLMALQLTPETSKHGRTSKALKFERRMTFLCENIVKLLVPREADWSVLPTAAAAANGTLIFPKAILDGIVRMVFDLVHPIDSARVIEVPDDMRTLIRKQVIESLARTRRAPKRLASDTSVGVVDSTQTKVPHRALLTLSQSEYEKEYAHFITKHSKEMAASVTK